MTLAPRVTLMPASSRLLFGPYTPPALAPGDRSHCLYRGRLCVVTGWSDALIPWPLALSVGARGGRPGLLVDAELARAIRGETVDALRHWWGVSRELVRRWKNALG